MSLSSHKTRVGVLRGGPSPEYEVSLSTGKNVLSNLPEEMYTPVDIFITKDGVWHEGGLPKSPENILKKIDVVWNALHGKYGEDGEVVKVFKHFHVPHTGSGMLSSALTMNKILAKKIYRDNGIKTPFSINIPFESLSREVIHDAYLAMPGPFVVKPATSGSSLGVRVAYSKPELEEAIVVASEYSPQILVEEFIKGKEVFVGVIDGFRNEKSYSLIPFSDRSLNAGEREMIKNISVQAHILLGLKHYSSSDFIVNPKRGVFILETDALPPLHSTSPFISSLHNVGSKIPEFLHHVISLALNQR